MDSTGIISRGFAKTAWDSLSAREIEYSRAVSRELVELANHWRSDVISFEYLGSLRPKREKYSRRSNQKRAYTNFL